MRLSTKSRYAVQSLIDLALRERSGPVALAQIAARQGVSLSYLEQLFSRLRRAALVESTRGPGGGYTLGRQASAIPVSAIVEAVEDDPHLASADSDRLQLTRDLWTELDRVMLRHLDAVPLQQLVDEQRAKGAPVDRDDQPKRALSAPPPARRLTTSAPNSVFAFGESFAARS